MAAIQPNSSRDLLPRTITKVLHKTLDHQLPRISHALASVDQVVPDPAALQECAQVDQGDLLQEACVPVAQVDLLQVCVQADQVALQAPDLPVALATYSATHSRSHSESAIVLG